MISDHFSQIPFLHTRAPIIILNEQIFMESTFQIQHPFLLYIALAAIACIVSLLTTPLVKKFAVSLDVLDKPATRKIHAGAIPRMGGLGIFLGIMAGLGFFAYYNPADFEVFLFGKNYIFVIVGATLMMGLGIADDKWGLNAKVKFSIQFLIAIFVVTHGLKIEQISNPFGQPFILGVLSYPITILWIVGVTNAINLSDGLDGLASGMSLIVSLTMFAVALTINRPGTIIMSAVLTGGLLGFLRYNFNPAQIFMGDTGSLLLGFLLAAISIKGTLMQSTTVSLIIPLVAMGLPIFDTLFAIFRRLMLGKNPFSADREHIHHRLLSYGLSQRQVVIIMYSICFIFGLLAFAMTAAQNELAASLLIIFGIIVYIGVQRLGYIETILVRLKRDRYRQKKKLYHALYHGTQESLPMWYRFYSWKSVIEGLLDLIFIVTALIVTRILFEGTEEFSSNLVILRNQILIVTTCCLGAFLLMGYYKALWRYVSLDSIGRFVKGVTLGTLFSYFALTFIDASLWISARHFVVFWVLLLVMVTASRLLFNFYTTYSKRQLTKVGGGERVLIYGAGDRGEVILNALIKEDVLNFKPVGFLDDNPLKQDKEILGYTVFGGIHRLETIVEEHKVQRIIISSPYINGIREPVLKEVCRKHGITLCHFKIQFDTISVEN